MAILEDGEVFKGFWWDWIGSRCEEQIGGVLVIHADGVCHEISMPSFKSAHTLCQSLHNEFLKQRKAAIEKSAMRINGELDRMLRE